MALVPEKILTADRIIIDIEPVSKNEVLTRLADLLGTSSEVENAVELREKVFEREKTLSTGVGVGIAVPHVKLPTIKDFIAAVACCKQGLDFDSLDGAPTHIIVMIGCNNTQSADFLKILARVVTRLKDKSLQRKILDAGSIDEVRTLFVGNDGVLS